MESHSLVFLLPTSTFHWIWSQEVWLTTDDLVFYHSLTLHRTLSGCSLMMISHLTFRQNRRGTESIAISASDWFTQALHLSPGDETDGLVQSNFAIRYEYWPFSPALPVTKRYNCMILKIFQKRNHISWFHIFLMMFNYLSDRCGLSPHVPLAPTY